jgi:hypothetical protein
MKKYTFLMMLFLALNLQQGTHSGYYEPEQDMPQKDGGISQDLYSPESGIYAAKPGASVRNLSERATPEPRATIGEEEGIKGQEARENTKPFSRVSSFSDPSRFIEIKADPEVAADEIDFWTRQMSEHALFLHLGLEEPKLKRHAKILHKLLEHFRRRFNQNPDDIELMNTILPLLQKERAFQIRALQAMDEGKWIGWIFPLFMNHITLELDYFVDKLNAIKYSPKDEVLFWNRINSEHAAFAAHLLDPAERELFLKADNLSIKFDKIPKSEREMMINLSLKASEELDKFNKTARAESKHIKSIIHPVLLDHVIREGERSIKTLSSLGLHDESAKFKQQYDAQLAQYNQYE